MNKKRILYIYPQLSSYSRRDLEILKSRYTVTEFFFDALPKYRTPFQFIRQFFFLLFNTSGCDLIIVQFAGYQSFLPALFGKLFKKPCLLILGGTDCFSFPSINYGNFNKPIQGLFTKWSYYLCTHISPVHESLVISDYTYDDKDFPKQGYQYFCPKVKAPFTPLYYGYDPDKFSAKGTVKEPRTFVTVGYGMEGNTFYRKGADMIFSVAPSLPDCKFTIVGCKDLSKFKNVPSNVTLLPPVSYDELMNIYARNQFYLQISIAEGFPSAVCEAMLCECIPLGSDVAAIPMIIGDTGFILKKRDKDLFIRLIKEALNSDIAGLQKKARNRIITEFPKKKREEQLIALVELLLEKPKC